MVSVLNSPVQVSLVLYDQVLQQNITMKGCIVVVASLLPRKKKKKVREAREVWLTMDEMRGVLFLVFVCFVGF